MRFIKMLGLAAMASMVAMAFVGASSAMAEPEHPEIVLCKELILKCELPDWDGELIKLENGETKHVVKIHTESLPAEPPKLLTSIGTVECESVLALFDLLNELAKLIEGHLLALQYKGCKLGSTSCTITVNAVGGFSFTPDEEKLKAKVELITLLEKNTNFTVKCGSLVNCTYEASAETKLLAESDEVGHFLLLANKTPLKGKGFLCPKEALWDVTLHAINLDEELTLRTGLWIEL